MPVLTVRNLSEEAHRALRVRAAQHGRSTEAEVRDILEASVRHNTERVKLGTFLFNLGREIGLTDEDVACLEQGRDRSPVTPVRFEE